MKRYQQLALDAKSLLEKHGWIQNDIGNKRRGFCIMGAVQEAKFLGGYKAVSYNTLRERIKESTLCNTPTMWNDEKGRTKEEILSVLDKVSKI
jgi:hypothetical protein